MSTHAYIPDPEMVRGLNPDNLIGDAVVFSLVMILLLVLFYLFDKRFFNYHHH